MFGKILVPNQNSGIILHEENLHFSYAGITNQEVHLG